MKILMFSNTDWYLYNFRLPLLLLLRDNGFELLLVSPPGPYVEKLRSLGFRWQALPMERGSINPVKELMLFGYLWRLFCRERPDLTHAFTIKCAVYGSLAARFSGVPARVSAVAGMGYVFISGSFKALVLRPIVRFLLRIALGGKNSRLILQNPDDVELFVRADLAAPESVRLIPGSGVDCNQFKPGFLPQVHPLRVLLPARLLWDKGLAEYTEAARLLKREGLEIDFLLAGEPDPGNPASVPESVVRGWVDEGVIHWLGHVDDMAPLFRSVHVVCLPSYREGLPKGLIEAGASGCALVTTNVPGCREVVDDGVDGLLVPVRDGLAIADALRKLHDDPDLRVRLGRAAREKAVREFEVASINDRTLRVYRELVPERIT